MAKFKVGDKVRIANPVLVSGYSLKDTVCTVTEIHDICSRSNKYTLSVKGNKLNQYWLDGELELVEPAPFTKADLKDGMVIENRGGTMLLLIGDVLMNNNQYIGSTNIQDDLTHKMFRNLDIVKVYTTNGTTFSTILNESNLTLIWERKEEPKHKEMTVEEIEKELGYKIKVIADNDSSNK